MKNKRITLVRTTSQTLKKSSGVFLISKVEPARVAKTNSNKLIRK